LETFLYILFFVSCVVLIISVLLQPGKTDAGALFTSGVSSAAMNPRGTASVLSKLTIVAAITFMLSALLISLPAITGRSSVLDSQSQAPPTSTTGNSNVNDNAANANSDVNANTSNVSLSNSEENTASNKKDSADENKGATEEKKDETKSDDKKPNSVESENEEAKKDGADNTEEKDDK